jgi:DNA-binding NarL/FixJ family response regulator
MPVKKLPILITDDHQIVIDGLKSLLAQHDALSPMPEFVCEVSEAHNGKEALAMLKQFGAEVVIMDLDMPVMNGIEATTQIKQLFPEVKIIILSMHEEAALIKKLLQLGADGYLFKNTSQAELFEAIQTVSEGGRYLPESVEQALHNRPSTKIESGKVTDTVLLAQMTEREIEIIRFVADGLTNKEIAQQLFISHRTVDTHRTNIMRKLDVTSVAGIVKFAYRNGLME